MKRTCPASVKLFLVLTLFTLVALASVSAQTEKILYTFTGGEDGATPYAGLVSDGKGNLYGTTYGGGSSICQCGTVFELSPGSNGTWSEQTIYSFAGTPSDGASPISQLIFDGKGNLYGTTVTGGNNGFGSVFELSLGTNSTWTDKTIYSFQFPGGIFPYGGVVRDPAGNLYGVTNQGGAYQLGTIFELTPGTDGSWTEETLYDFTGANDGSLPENLLILDPAGNLYGTAQYAGPNDYGSVFELKRGSSDTWTLKVIYAFTGVSGLNPASSLVFDSAGNLYGTAETTAFELVPGSNGTWTEEMLHAFTGGSDGADAVSGLTLDKGGNLYGTTGRGGLHQGTVYKLKPGSGGSWSEKILHRFAGGAGDGAFPSIANLLRDASGNLYGTTPSGGRFGAGVVYEITP
jgi:uncharacterized repeat protein (TIGR03803 family)